MVATEQATGSRCQGGAPAAKRGRTTLTPGWRLLRHPPATAWWRACSGAHQTRQPIVGRASATLMYAGRNRKLSIRRKLPQTWNAPVARQQRRDGDLACDGGWLARLVNPGHPWHNSAR
jgi:hypothetical protein